MKTTVSQYIVKWIFFLREILFSETPPCSELLASGQDGALLLADRLCNGEVGFIQILFSLFLHFFCISKTDTHRRSPSSSRHASSSGSCSASRSSSRDYGMTVRHQALTRVLDKSAATRRCAGCTSLCCARSPCYKHGRSTPGRPSIRRTGE